MSTIENRQPGTPRYRWLLFVLLVAFGLYVTGLLTPLMTLRKFWSKNEVSILVGLWDMMKEGHYFLFVLIFIFTIIFPLIKFFMLFALCVRKNVSDARMQKRIERLAHVSKWSMLDVFVVAVLVVTVKLGAIAKVKVHYGLYIFATSVLITMIVTFIVLKRESSNPGTQA